MSETITNSLPETALRTADFDYELPQELIAQHPTEKRDASRLMVLNRQTHTVEHRHFSDLTDYLRPGTCWWSTIPRSFPRGCTGAWRADRRR